MHSTCKGGPCLMYQQDQDRQQQQQQAQEQLEGIATATTSSHAHISSRNSSRKQRRCATCVAFHTCAIAVLLVLLLDPSLHVTHVAAGMGLYNTTAPDRTQGKLTVHLMPHAHLDPGWLVTFEQYYRGWAYQQQQHITNPIVVTAGVSQIIESVIGALLLNPDRTFVFADMAFFIKWWAVQPSTVRDRVRGLVAAGQLQFVNGGLVQHDEATSHYSSIIDHMGVGMRFLAQELGVEPKVAWLIDNFGHSRTEPLLRTQGGFEALFVSRIDKQDMAERTERHEMELVWRGSPAFGRESDLWVHVSPTGTYTTPADWIQLDPTNQEYQLESTLMLDDGSQDSFAKGPPGVTNRPNVIATLNQLYEKAWDFQRAAPPGTNDVMMYMGCDFAFKNAPAWFEFLDALVHYANREGVMNVVFSTPDRFLEAKKQQAKAAASSSAAAAAAADGGAAADAEEANGVVTDVAATQASYEEVGGGDSSSSSIGSTSSEDSSRQGDSASAHDARGSSSSTSSSQNTTGVRWPLKEDDFFPYRCEQDRFWTGFYSSKPSLKGMIRTAAAVLQATRQLEVITGLTSAPKTLPTTHKGRDLLKPQPPPGSSAAAAANAAAAAISLQQQYDAAVAGAADAFTTAATAAAARRRQSKDRHKDAQQAQAAIGSGISSSSSGSDGETAGRGEGSAAVDDAGGGESAQAQPIEYSKDHQQHVQQTQDALAAATAARDSGFVSAWDEVGRAGVPEGPDTSVLVFAVALAHHHDAITGTQKQDVHDDYAHWLHVGMQRAVPKLLLALQRLVFIPLSSSGSVPSDTAVAAVKTSRHVSRQTADAAAAAAPRVARELHSDSSSDSSDSSDSSSSDDSSTASQSPMSDVISLSHPLPGLIISGGDQPAGSNQPQDSSSNSGSSNSGSSSGSSSNSRPPSLPSLPPLSYCLLLNASLCTASVQMSRGVVDSTKGEADSTQVVAGAAAAAAGGEDEGANGGHGSSSSSGGSGTEQEDKGSSRGFLLVVYNPLSWPVSQQGVRVPVDTTQTYQVTGPGGVLVPSQLLALPPRSSEVWEAAALNHLSSPTHDDTAALALQVDVPALGHAVYRVEAVVGSTAHDGASGSVAAGSDKTASSSSSHSSMQARQLHPQGDTTLSNGQLEVTVSPEKGGVTNVRVLSSQQQYAFSATLAHYQADKLFRRTGAYIFTMREQSEVKLPLSKVELYEGPVVTEVRQVWDLEQCSGSLVTRLWRGAAALEVEWTGGPAPTDLNWEMFVRYETDIASGGVWYTDANGLEWQQRRLGYRPSFDLKGDNSMPANIYPITTGALLRETTSDSSSSTKGGISARALYVSTDRAQGAMSLSDGQLSILLHRGSMEDDGKGLDEPLTDSSIAVGRHIISFGVGAAGQGRQQQQQHQQQQQQQHARHHQQALNDPLQLAFSPLPSIQDATQQSYAVRETSSFLAAAATAPTADAGAGAEDHHRSAAVAVAGSPSSHEWPSLPANVHVLSLQWQSCGTVLVRLVNIFQAGEGVSSSGGSLAGAGGDDDAAVVPSLWRLFDWEGSSLNAGVSSLTVTGVREVTLFGGNRPLNDSDLQPPASWAPLGERITKWAPDLWPPVATATDAPHSFQSNRIIGPIDSSVDISLAPMQIRAFLVTVEANSGGSRQALDLGPFGVVAACTDEVEQGGARRGHTAAATATAAQPVDAREAIPPASSAVASATPKPPPAARHTHAYVSTTTTTLASFSSTAALPDKLVILLMSRVLLCAAALMVASLAIKLARRARRLSSSSSGSSHHHHHRSIYGMRLGRSSKGGRLTA